MKKQQSFRENRGNRRQGTSEFVLRPIVCGVMLAWCHAASANPTSAQVVNGAASFTRPDARTLNITNTPGAIINWQGFSIAAGEVTRFTQQNALSTVLNRVVGADISKIQGQLLSNGRVFLINPAGILIGAGAVIDTAGFVGSSLNMLDRDFLAGRLSFDGAGGAVVNRGTISAAGDIFLVGANVQNSGLVRSESGNVVLAAGKSVTITSPAVEGVQFTLQAPTDTALNLGTIEAGNAVGMFAGTLRHSGDVRAGNIALDASGRVMLAAQKDATVARGATIAARGGDGGSVTIQSGDSTFVSGSIDASGTSGAGGTVHILGNRVGLLDGARVSATGETGGGTILVGGGYQGRNPGVQNAWRTFVGRDVPLNADARGQGNGGKVIVWADDSTHFAGRISARGGERSGDGGFAEVSGKGTLDFRGRVDTRAPNGRAGTLLLDPTDIDIVAGGVTSTEFTLVGADTFFAETTPTATSQITIGDLNAALANGNVEITTASAATAPGGGDITFAAAYDFNGIGGARTLTLNATDSININNPISDSVADADRLTLVLNAGTATNINADIALGGGALNSNALGSKVVNMNTGAPTISNVSAFTVGTLNIGGATATLNTDTTAAALNLTAGILTGNNDLSVTSAFARTAGTTLNPAGDLSINQAAGTLSTNGPISSGTIQLTAAGGILADELTGGRITVTSTGSDVRLDGTLNASNVLNLPPTTAAINVTAAGNVFIGDANLVSNSSGGITIQAAGEIAYDNTTAVNTTNGLNTVGDVSLISTGSRIYRSGVAGGNNNFLNVAGRNVTFTAVGEIATPGTVTADGSLTLTSTAGAITTTLGAMSAASGNVGITASTGITAGAITASNGTLTLASSANNGDVRLNGNLTATNTGLSPTTNAIDVSSGRNFAIGNADIRANTSGGVRLEAAGELFYDNTVAVNTTNVLTAAGNVALTSTGSRIYRSGVAGGNNNFFNVSGGAVAFSTVGELTTAGTVTASGPLTMTSSAGGITTTLGAMSAASGNVGITAAAGIDAGAITASSGTITLASNATNADVLLNGALAATNTGLSAGAFAIDVASGRSLAVRNDLRANTSGGIRLRTAGDLFYDNTAAVNTTNVVAAVGDVSLISTGSRIYRSGVAAGNNNLLNISGGSVTLDAATTIVPVGDTITSTAGGLTLNAVNGITASRLTAAGGAISLIATGGASDILLPASLEATNTGLALTAPAITVSAGRSVSIANADIKANTSGAIAFTAGGEIVYDNTITVNTRNVLTAIGNVSLTSTGSRVYRSGVAAGRSNVLDVTGADVTFTAAGEITTPGAVTAGGPLILTSSGGAVTTTAAPMSAASGNVAISSVTGISAGAITASNGRIVLASSATNADVFLHGDLTATNIGLPPTTNAIDVSSGRSFAILDADLRANTSGGIRLQAVGELFYDNTLTVNTTNVLAAAGNVALTSTGSRIYRSGVAAGNNNFFNISGDAVEFNTVGELTTPGTVTASGALTLTSSAGGIATTTGAMSAAAGNVGITAAAGIVAGAITASNGRITLASGATNADVFLNGNLTATSTGLAETTYAIDASSGRSLAIGNADLRANTSGGIRVQAAADLFYDNTVTVNTTNVLAAAGNVALGSTNTRIYRSGVAGGNNNLLDITGANVTLTAAGAIDNLGRAGATRNVTFGGASVGAGGSPFGLGTIGGVVNATASGPGEIHLSGNASLTTGTLSTGAGVQALQIQVTGATSDITVGSTLNTTDNVSLTAGRDVLFTGGTSIAANALSLAGPAAGAARFGSSGTITIAAPVTSTLPFDVGGATVNLNGAGVSSASALTITSGTVNVNAGRLQLTGDLTSNGTLNVFGTGSDPTIDVAGNLTFNGLSVLGVDLAGTAAGTFGRFAVRGSANLDGTLNVTTSGGFAPATNDAFRILTYASRSNDFAVKNYPDLYTYSGFPSATFYDIRVIAAPDIWTNGSGDGRWQTNANWRDLSAPTAADNALIPDVAGAGADTTVTVSAAGQAAARVVSSENLAIASGDLTLGAGNSSISANALLSISGGTLTTTGALTAGTLGLSAGTLNGGGPVTVDTLNWTGTSTISGTGALNVNTSLAMSGAGAVHILAGGRTVNNFGAATLSGAGQLRTDPGGSTFNNRPGASFTLADDGSVTDNALPGGVFVNEGTLAKTGGAGTSLFASALTNSGQVNVGSGTLHLTGSSTHTTGTVSVTGGTLQLSGGAHNFNAGSTLGGAGNLTVGGGTANFDGTLSLANAFNFTAGQAFFDPVSGAITAAQVGISGGTADFSVALTTPTINLSAGTLSGTGAVTVDTLNWTGSSRISGTGALNVNTTLAMSGAGAPHILAGGRTVNNFGAATLSGGGQLRTDPGGSTFNNKPGASFTLTDDSSVTDNALPGGVFVNEGTIAKTGGVGTSLFAGTLTNSGQVNVSSGTLNLFGSSTHTTGSVSVGTNATLQLSGGTHNLNAGSTLDGAGNLTVSGGTSNVNGTMSLANRFAFLAGQAFFNPVSGPVTATQVDISGGTADFGVALTTPTINLSAGVLSGTGAVTVDTLNWTAASTITGTGALNVNTSLAMSGFGAPHILAGGRTVNNFGAATLAGSGQLRTDPGGSTFNNKPGASFTISDGSSVTDNAAPGGVFVNEGTLAKTGGAGTSVFDSALTNTAAGTVNASSGTLLLTRFATNSGSVNIAAGAALATNGNNLTNAATGAIGGEGTLNLATATLTNDGLLRPGAASIDTTGTLSITGNLASGAGGRVNIELGGTAPGDYDVLAISGTAALAGTLDVIHTGGFAPIAGNAFDVLTYGSRSNDFVTKNTPTDFTYSVVPGATSYPLTLSAATNRWIGTTGTWQTAGNWSLARAPNATDDAVIDVGGAAITETITVSAAGQSARSVTAAERLVVATGGALTLGGGVSTAAAGLAITGGTLTANGSLDVSTLDVSGGTLNGSGAVTAAAPFTWSGGTVAGSGAFTTNAATTITGPVTLDTRTWSNAGTVDQTGASRVTLANNAVIHNQATRAWNLSSSDATPITGAGTFNNEGTFTNTGAAHTLTNSAFINSATGTLNVTGGMLGLTGFATNAGTIGIAAGATLATGGANLTNAATGTIGGEGALDLTSATLTNDGLLRPGAASGDTTGTLSITGNLASGTGGRVNVELGGVAAGEFDVLAVSGTANLSGNLDVTTPGAYAATTGDRFTVVTAGTVTGQFTTITQGFGNPLTPVYSGSALQLIIGGGTLNSWILDGDGSWTSAANWSLGHVPTAGEQVTIDRPAGIYTITLPPGAFSVDLLNSSENIVIAGGTLGLSNASTINAALAMSSGRLEGAGLLTVNGPFALTGGIIANTAGVRVNNTTAIASGAPQIASALITDTLNMTGGNLTIAAGGVLGITGNAASTISAATLVNDGTMTISGNGNVVLTNAASLVNTGAATWNGGAGGIAVDLGSTLTNSASGTLTLNAATADTGITGAGTLRNDGLLKSIAGGIRTLIGSVFNSAGAVEVQGGTLQLTGGGASAGSYAVDAGTVLEFGGGTHSLNPGAALSGAGAVVVSGGTLTVNTPMTIANPLTIGNATLDNQSTLTLAGAMAISGGTLNNAGTFRLAGPGNVSLDNGAALNNSGRFDIQSDAGIDHTSGATPTIVNSGTFVKSGGAGTSTIGITSPVVFTNAPTGTLEVQAGTLKINGGFPVNAGTLRVAAGTTFSTGGNPLENQGTISGTGTVDLAGATLLNNGIVSPGDSPGTLTIDGDYLQSSIGTLVVEVGGTTQGAGYDLLKVTGASGLDGVLNVALVNGFTPTSTNAFDFLTYSTRVGDFGTFVLPSTAGIQAQPSASFYQINFASVAPTFVPTFVPTPTPTPLQRLLSDSHFVQSSNEAQQLNERFLMSVTEQDLEFKLKLPSQQFCR